MYFRRTLVSELDLDTRAVLELFELVKVLKQKQKMGEPHELLKGKSLAMIFQKPSTRTRVSFEVGMTQLGGHALYLGPNDLQLNRGETVADTARVLSRYVDGIMARVFAHSDIVTLAEEADVPVINGLSDESHPCQALTDFFTVYEKYGGELRGVKMAYVGDGDNNMTYSLVNLAAIMGVDMTVASPKKFGVKKELVAKALEIAKVTRAKLEFVEDPVKAVKGAQIVHTDVWVSMGREDKAARVKALTPYQVNAKLMKQAERGALVMHCLPAHRGEEITDEVIDGPQSVVFDQAENRLHVQKAIMVQMMR